MKDAAIMEALEPGTVFTVHGERGKFTLKRVRPDGTYDCWGGMPYREMFRTFGPEQVRTIKKGKS